MRKYIVVIIVLFMCLFSTNNVMANNILNNNENENLAYDIVDPVITGIFTLLGVLIGFIGLYINNKLEHSRKKEEQISNILLEKYNGLIILLNRLSEKKTAIKYVAFNRIAMEYYEFSDFEENRNSLNMAYEEILEIENIFYDINVYIQNNSFIIEKKIKYKNYNVLFNIMNKERSNVFFRMLKTSLQLGKKFTQEELRDAEQKYNYFLNRVHELIIELKEEMEYIIFK